MAEPHDSPDATTAPARTRPLWYRRGLLGFLILLLVAGAGVGWRLNQAKPERAAVVEIRDAGGATQTSWEFHFLREPTQGLDLANRPEASNLQVNPIWPDWLLNALGADFFTRVTAVHFSKGTAPALLASTLPRLPTVEMLSIADSSPLAGGLAPVRALPNLQGVYVDGAGLKPADLADLAAAPDLRLLAVGPTSGSGKLVDADLAGLAGATRLEGFRLGREPAVTDEAMAALVAKWPNLEEFTWLEAGHPVPLTLRSLAEHHPKLRRLAVTNAPFADADLAPLAPLAGLTSLKLDGSGLTDAALGNLTNHHGLVSLFLPNLEVKGDGFRALAPLGDLVYLDLRRSKLAEGSLAHLPRLGHLTDVDLSGAELAGGGWEPLAAWTQLQGLMLSGSNLDDAGLRALAPLKATLRTLDIAGTPVVAKAAAAAEAIEAFKAGAPATLRVVDRHPGAAAGGR